MKVTDAEDKVTTEGSMAVARRLAIGYNDQASAHGPDGDGAAAEGRVIEVVHEGRRYRLVAQPVAGGRRGTLYEMARTCGLQNCSDPAHREVQATRKDETT
jgi:hypothetical protein